MIDAVVPSRPRAHGPGDGVTRTLRLASRASNALCALALSLLAVLLLGSLAGFRPLLDYSNSMRPAISTGDVLVTHAAPAASIRPGQIVTFHDPSLDGRLVTHRVIAIHASHRRLEFLTRGDANAAPEHWSVAQRGSVGKVALRIPEIGRATVWITNVPIRTAMMALVTLVLSVALLRRIWST